MTAKLRAVTHGEFCAVALMIGRGVIRRAVKWRRIEGKRSFL